MDVIVFGHHVIHLYRVPYPRSWIERVWQMLRLSLSVTSLCFSTLLSSWAALHEDWSLPSMGYLLVTKRLKRPRCFCLSVCVCLCACLFVSTCLGFCLSVCLVYIISRQYNTRHSQIQQKHDTHVICLHTVQYSNPSELQGWTGPCRGITSSSVSGCCSWITEFHERKGNTHYHWSSSIPGIGCWYW